MTKAKKVLNSLPKLSNSNICIIVSVVILIIVIILFAIFFPRNINKNLTNENFVQMTDDESVNQYTEEYENDVVKESFTSNKKTFVMFYAPWCGHCKRTMPAYQRIIDSYKNDQNITVIKVDCDQNKNIARDHGIQGFPTFRLYPTGMNNKNNYEEYEGGRTFEDINEYIKIL